MRILFLYHFPMWGNGSGAFLRELTAELIKRGHTIGVVAPDKRKLPGVKHYVAHPPQMGVFVGHPELPKAKKFGDMDGKELGDIYLSYFKVTLEAVSDFKPDVIHVFHIPFLPEIARIIKVLFGIKYIITTHGSDLSFLAKDKRYIPLLHEANRAATAITANSDFVKLWFLRLFGEDTRKKTSVIVGGVNLEHYKRETKHINEINRKYNLKGKNVVLFTGRLTQHKGVIYLAKAAQKMNNAVVVIVGDGPERKEIEAFVKKKGLPNVVFTGYINTTNPMFHAFYERADIFVSPSVWDEPLGLTILEAMAAKTPVIATRKGGVVTMINEGVNGFLVRARNSSEIADTVNLLLADEKLRLKMGNAAYKTVVERFSWDKIAGRFEKLYEGARGKEKVDAGPMDELLTKIFTPK
jgi:glycosyltransferase involved in cell wall biosynthesis